LACAALRQGRPTARWAGAGEGDGDRALCCNKGRRERRVHGRTETWRGGVLLYRDIYGWRRWASRITGVWAADPTGARQPEGFWKSSSEPSLRHLARGVGQKTNAGGARGGRRPRPAAPKRGGARGSGRVGARAHAWRVAGLGAGQKHGGLAWTGGTAGSWLWRGLNRRRRPGPGRACGRRGGACACD
jgi:hypothetical protein